MLNIKLLHDPEILFLRYLPRRKTNVLTRTCVQMLIAALFTIVKKWKSHICPSMVTGLKKWNNEISFTNKKESKYWYISTWMILTIWMNFKKHLIQRSQAIKEHILQDSSYTEYLKKQICRGRKYFSGSLGLGWEWKVTEWAWDFFFRWKYSKIRLWWWLHNFVNILKSFNHTLKMNELWNKQKHKIYG